MLYRKQERKVDQNNLCWLTFRKIYSTYLSNQTNDECQSNLARTASMPRKISIKKLNSCSSKKKFCGLQSSQHGKFQPINSCKTEFEINSAHILKNGQFKQTAVQKNKYPLNRLFEPRLNSINDLRSIRSILKNTPTRIKISYLKPNQKMQNEITISRQISRSPLSSEEAKHDNNHNRVLSSIEKRDENLKQQIEVRNQDQQIPSINIELVELAKQSSSNLVPYTGNGMQLKKTLLSTEMTKSKISSSNMGQQFIERRQNQQFDEELENVKKSKKMSRSHLVIQKQIKKQATKSGVYSNFHISDTKLSSSLIFSDQSCHQLDQISLKSRGQSRNNIVKSIVSQQEEINPDNMRKLMKMPNNNWANRIQQTFVSIANQQSKVSMVSAEFSKRKSMCTNAAQMLFSPSEFQVLEIE